MKNIFFILFFLFTIPYILQTCALFSFFCLLFFIMANKVKALLFSFNTFYNKFSIFFLLFGLTGLGLKLGVMSSFGTSGPSICLC